MNGSNLRTLIIDDERAIRRFLRVALSRHDHDVLEAETGDQGLAAATAARPDLIILDLGLPDMDGLEVLRRLREWSTIPVIVLSVRGQEDDKIAALDAGADDYITKPFAVGELLARIRTALRHAAREGGEPVFSVGDLTVDLGRRLVTVAGREIALTPTEYDLLKILVANAGKVLTHRQLVTQIWGPNYAPDRHLLQVNVSNLRRKLEADPARPRYVITEPGVGYRLRVND